MAHIDKVGKACRARYRLPDGRETSPAFARKIDAENFLTGIASAKLRGEYVDPLLGKVTVGQWVARWYPTTAHLKPTTRAGYESVISTCILPTFERVQLRHIQPIDVKE